MGELSARLGRMFAPFPEPSADLTPYLRAMTAAADDMARSLAKVGDIMTSLSTAFYPLQRARNPLPWEAKLSGWEARLYVRGGHASSWDVKDVLRGRTDPDLRGLLPAERARLAVAQLQGYVAHHAMPDPCAQRCAYADAVGAESWATCSGTYCAEFMFG
jgi:hypothetical protein